MTDAFDRLKNRTRPTVPLRDASLTKELNDEKTDFSHSVETNFLNEEMQEDVPEAETAPEFEVIRRTIRLEQSVDEGLEGLCSREKVTRETFLEAAYSLCVEKPELLQEILAIAKDRYRLRKAAGERRKFQTMGKKYTH
jgi:hypothetical protein